MGLTMSEQDQPKNERETFVQYRNVKSSEIALVSHALHSKENRAFNDFKMMPAMQQWPYLKIYLESINKEIKSLGQNKTVIALSRLASLCAQPAILEKLLSVNEVGADSYKDQEKQPTYYHQIFESFLRVSSDKLQASDFHDAVDPFFQSLMACFHLLTTDDQLWSLSTIMKIHHDPFEEKWGLEFAALLKCEFKKESTDPAHQDLLRNWGIVFALSTLKRQGIFLGLDMPFTSLVPACEILSRCSSNYAVEGLEVLQKMGALDLSTVHSLLEESTIQGVVKAWLEMKAISPDIQNQAILGESRKSISL